MFVRLPIDGLRAFGVQVFKLVACTRYDKPEILEGASVVFAPEHCTICRQEGGNRPQSAPSNTLVSSKIYAGDGKGSSPDGSLDKVSIGVEVHHVEENGMHILFFVR